MIFPLFSKMLASIMFIQHAYAQDEDDADNYWANLPKCPNSSLVYYKDCKGALDQCSTCLGNAERACGAALKKEGKDTRICYYCTTQVAGNCDNIKSMCFGNQECGDPNYKCIDFTCTYQAPSK